MTTLDLGKTAASAASTAGAQARKRREIRFENPFTDFLERRGEGWGQVRQRKSAIPASSARWNEFDWGKAATSTDVKEIAKQ